MDHDDDRPLFVPIRSRLPISMSSRLRRKTATRWPWFVADASLGTTLMLCAVWLVRSNKRPPVDASVAINRPPVGRRSALADSRCPPRPMSTQSDRGLRLYTVRKDDGTMLWAPPGDGRPIDLRNCPTGAQCLLYLRPADLLHHPEGLRCWRAIDFEAVARRTDWEQTHQVELSEISEMILTWVPRGPDIDLVDHCPLGPGDFRKLWRGREVDRVDGGANAAMDRFGGTIGTSVRTRSTNDRMGTQGAAGIDCRAEVIVRPVCGERWSRCGGDATTNQQVILLLPPQFLSRDGRSIIGVAMEATRRRHRLAIRRRCAGRDDRR